MSTLLSTPRSTPATTGRRRTLNHYVRQSAILAGIVHGTPATALCGEQFVPRSQGDGSAAVSGAVLCPACSARYDSLAR